MQRFLLPQPCRVAELEEGEGTILKLENAPGKLFPTYTPCPWAPGTRWAVPGAEAGAHSAGRPQGGARQHPGMRGAGGSRQGLSCIRLRVQLVNAVPAPCPF